MNYIFNYKRALYRRNNFGEPCVWDCEKINEHNIKIFHSIIGKAITSEITYTSRLAEDEIKSRINAKRKAGYKFLYEIKDDTTLPVEGNLLTYLLTYLPKDRTTSDGALLPMLAKVYDNDNNKLFNKCSSFIGQYKINGLRCFVSAKVNSGDMFKPVSLEFRSREGTIWKSLSNLEEYLLQVLDKNLIAKMIDEHYILDGELYLPGHNVNEINHFVKDPNCEENKFLQYWCYDIAIENMNQFNRIKYISNIITHGVKVFGTKEQHLNNKNRLVILPFVSISNGEEATNARNKYIDLGFEGLILRNPDAEYQFGKRNLSMIKYKKATDGIFRIVDIKPEGIKRPDIPIFVCANDINDATFECHIGGELEFQKRILVYRQRYIGKNLYITYGERSGVNQVPFHIKDVHFHGNVK
jgi:hypothetical protein